MKFNRLTLPLFFTAIALGVFFLARIALYVTQQAYFESLDGYQTLFGFVHGIRFDLSIILLLYALPILLLAPVAGTWRRGWVTFLSRFMFVILVGCSIGLTADIIYFDYVKRHAGNELLLLGNDLDFVFDIMSGTYLAVFAIVLAAMIPLYKAWAWGIKHYQPDPAPWWTAWPVAIVACTLLIIGARGSFVHKPINVINAYVDGSSKLAALSLNGVFSSLKTMTRSSKVKHNHFEEKALPSLAKVHGIQDTRVTPFLRQYTDNQPNHRNIVILFMESWTYRFFDALSGAQFNVTPTIDALSKESLVVSRFYAAGQRSVIGLQAALTGLPHLPGQSPIGNGLEVANYSRLGNLAKQNGYQTLFVQTSKRSSFRLDSIVQSIGFDTFYGMEDIPITLNYPDKHGSRFGWDYEGLQTLLGQIDEKQQTTPEKPFVAGFFSGTTHAPFPQVPAQFRRYPHSKTGEHGYLNTLNYSDWSVGEFLKAARQRPWFDNTIFIITADHVLGKDVAPTLPDMYRIPFMIYAPKLIKPGTIDVIGSQLDLLPTVIDLLGFSQPFASLGESIFRKQEDFALVNQERLLGAINAEGWLSHNLKQRIDSGTFNGEAQPQALDKLEKQLLIYDQVTYNTLQANTWAPRPE